MISSSDSSAAARPTSGRAPAPRPWVTPTPIWMRRSALRLRQRLRVGVADDEIDAFEVRADHVVDGVAAGAADAEHGDARLATPVLLRASFRFSVIAPISPRDAPSALTVSHVREPAFDGMLKLLTNPADPSGRTGRSNSSVSARPRRGIFGALGQSEMNQAGRRREGRSRRRFGKALETRAAGRCEPVCRESAPASSRMPGSGERRRSARRGGRRSCRSPKLSSRSRTSSKVSSSRGGMMPTSSDFGTWFGVAVIVLADLRHGDQSRARRSTRRCALP